MAAILEVSVWREPCCVGIPFAKIAFGMTTLLARDVDARWRHGSRVPWRHRRLWRIVRVAGHQWASSYATGAALRGRWRVAGGVVSCAAARVLAARGATWASSCKPKR